MSEKKQQILEVALAEYVEHGSRGASLKKIAGQLDVTKAMIHYYFDTRDKLFEAVYREAVVLLFQDFGDILNNDVPLFQKIEQLIEECIQLAEQKDELLAFVMGETKRAPDALLPLFSEEYSVSISAFDKQLNEAASNYEIAAVPTEQVLLNIFSLCFYPSISAEISEVMVGNNSREENRKGIVLDTVLNWLTS